jgi:hypothetical protein
MKYLLTMKSSNVKTGPIPVSMSSKFTCPIDCAFYWKPSDDNEQGGCYGANGHLNIHWNAVTGGTRGVEFDAFCHQVASMPKSQLWRYGVAGDLPGMYSTINGVQLKKLVRANDNRECIAYSHKYNSRANLALIKYANDNGMTINLSANNLKHADSLSKHDMPVVVALPIRHLNDPKVVYTPAGLKVLTCPAVTSSKVTCKSCGLCAKRDRFDQKTGQRLIVGFPAHGSRKKLVNSIVTNGVH